MVDRDPIVLQQALLKFWEVIDGLREDIQTVSEKSRDDAAKLDALRTTMNKVTGGLIVIAALISVGGAVCGFFLKMILDVVVTLVQHPPVAH